MKAGQTEYGVVSSGGSPVSMPAGEVRGDLNGLFREDVFLRPVKLPIDKVGRTGYNPTNQYDW